MTPTVAELALVMEQLAPLRFAEPWDNVGLLTGDPSAPLERALLTIDYTDAVADEAEAWGASAVIAYHPPIFKGLTRLLAGTPIVRAVQRGIAIYSPHTALDVAAGGTNDTLADLLGLQDVRAVRPGSVAGSLGMGRIGEISPVPLADFLVRVGRALLLPHLLVAGPRDRAGELVIDRVAVGAGSCGDLLEAAVRLGAKAFVTGEVRHHDALAAIRAGLVVVATLHSNSERSTLEELRSRLAMRLPGAQFMVSERDADPFRVVQTLAE